MNYTSLDINIRLIVERRDRFIVGKEVEKRRCRIVRHVCGVKNVVENDSRRSKYP